MVKHHLVLISVGVCNNNQWNMLGKFGETFRKIYNDYKFLSTEVTAREKLISHVSTLISL